MQPAVARLSIVSTTVNDKVNDLTKEIWSLRKTVVEQQKQIDALKDNHQNLNDRLRTQERYTRKDSVLIINPPFDARTAEDFTNETLVFFLKKCCKSSWPIVMKRHAISYQTRDVEG